MDPFERVLPVNDVILQDILDTRDSLAHPSVTFDPMRALGLADVRSGAPACGLGRWAEYWQESPGGALHTAACCYATRAAQSARCPIMVGVKSLPRFWQDGRVPRWVIWWAGCTTALALVGGALVRPRGGAALETWRLGRVESGRFSATPPWSSYNPRAFVHFDLCTDFEAVLDQNWSPRDLELTLFDLKSNISKMKPQEVSLRRRQLACLFWQLHDAYAAAHIEMDPALLTLLHDVMMDYWRSYRDRARRKLWMYHFHISKAGGTHFCRVARRNGCTEPGVVNTPHAIPATNCLAKDLGDGPSWNPGNVGRLPNASEGHRSCRGRKEYLTAVGVNYEANEKWASAPDDDPTCSDDALSYTVLRDPVERTVSMLSNSKPSLIVDHVCPGVDPQNQSRVVFDPECVLELKYYSTDNYQVRMLGGFQAANRPLGGVLDEDVNQAKRLTRMLDTLFIQHGGEPQFMASDSSHLALGLGFDVFRNMTVHKRKEAHGWSVEDFMFTDHHYEVLRKRNEKDYELFRYGFALWELDHFLMHHTELVCAQTLGAGVKVPYAGSLTCKMLHADVDPLRQGPGRFPKGIDHATTGMWRPSSCGCGFVGHSHVPRPECLDDFVQLLPH
ncbi:hypothetical protein FVE85_6428 [Porphyridium purpureum]|uniref:Uncharacterized protein n=1 Tax=Porphyridium purpureum TaxID=35688 RepID=A0A5J4Z7N0_PORPP|nr:hypothetical protein FVE85_6428 [Porphyridium purpureum]|eukprot:POR6392..scf295_1